MHSRLDFLIYLAVFMFISMLSSCKLKSNLNRKQKAWIPYHGSEILIFQSSAGKSDTLFLEGRESFYTSNNPLDPFGKRFQCQRLNFQYMRPNDSSNLYIQGTMIQLTRLPNGDAEFYLGIETRGGGFNSGDKYTVSKLDKLIPETLEIANKKYTDIIAFSPSDISTGMEHIPYIDKICYSKRYGIVQYVTNQVEVWTLCPEKNYI